MIRHKMITMDLLNEIGCRTNQQADERMETSSLIFNINKNSTSLLFYDNTIR